MWSVSALNHYMKNKIDADAFLQGILIQGEISNFNRHFSGHWYFTLKDERSRISCVMFASNASKNAFVPTNGMKVFVKGSLSVFETSGQYQVYVSKITEDGIGDLYYQFELLKKKLADEGLFDEKYKKPIPKYPMKIGVVSGADTAALHDIRTTIARRWPIAEICEFHSLVQGEQAKYELVQALQEADVAGCDVIIVARGGGSIEDLWAFNEEMVARCIFACKTPIITGVGHEIDTTIVDFVSDRRAPTPTGAAELATSDYKKVLIEIDGYRKRLLRLQLLQMPTLQLDFYKQRLDQYLQQIVLKQQEVMRYQQRLQQSAKLFMVQQSHSIDTKRNHLLQLMEYKQNQAKQEFIRQLHLLDAYSPLEVLKRGYAIVSTDQQISSIEQVEVEEALKIRLQDGYIESIVSKKESL